MMNPGSATSHGDQHQKDFLNSFFSSESSTPSSEHDHQRSRAPPQDIFQGNVTASTAPHPSLMSMQQQQSINSSHVGMDVLESMIAMQERAVQVSSGSQGVHSATPQMLLEQQVRLTQLQQLQQLQNQIFQQQMELLSGNPSFSSMPSLMDRSRDLPQYGLPTPASSTELHAQPSTDFVSPMLLQTQNSPMANIAPTNQLPPNFMTQHMIPPTPHSAPANIAFQSSYAIPSPAELEFPDISPLTSPWLGAYPHSSNNHAESTGGGGRSGQVSGNASGKRPRTSSASGDETSSATTSSTAPNRPQRKRQSSSARLGGTNMSTVMNCKKASSNLRGTRSANSTPLFPPTATSRLSPRRNGPNIGDVPTDTPSPVELSMPPPAPPVPSSGSTVQFVHGGSGQSAQANPGRVPPEHLTPVTPASIMNLGRLGTNSALVPTAVVTQPSSGGPAVGEKAAKGKPMTRSRASTISAVAQSQSGSKGTASMSLVSPSLKPIRPAGNAPASSTLPSMQIQQQPILHVRKTSHKAAEQKRRDSLKTSFDDLRMLLPPIPLPSDEGYPDEPVLPGAMPPRGPPKGNVDGPNRGVSKLQLLRCGNDFIRVLKGRVERRDDEIEILRREIKRLRLLVGNEYGEEVRDPPEEKDLDLEKDLDACEFGIGGVLVRSNVNGFEDEDGDEDGGE